MQATRSVGAGKTVAGKSAGAHASVARRAHPTSPRTPERAVRATVASGPAPSYFGFALSLLILLGAAAGLSLGALIWAVDSFMRKAARSD